MSKTKTEVNFEIDTSKIKRFYCDNVITVTCPECGGILTQDLSGHGMSYPEENKPELIYFSCEEHDDVLEFYIELFISNVITKVTLEYDTDSLERVG